MNRSRLLLFVFTTLSFHLHAQDKEVSFEGLDGTTLSGALHEVENPKALAVLLSVAGPTTRDLNLGPHKYYKVLADSLANQGIASLRFDDRGVGGSAGDLAQSSFKVRVTDACAAFNELKIHYPDVRIGFIGTSEGGGIAVSTQGACDPEFAVLLSTPVLTGPEIMTNQMARALKGSALPQAVKDSIGILAQTMLLLAQSDKVEAIPRLEDLFKAKYGNMLLPPYNFVPQKAIERAEFIHSPWYQSQVNYNVQKSLENLSIPAMAIYGSKDTAINPVLNANKMRELNSRVEVIEIEGLNHLIQEAKTGSPTEYMFLPTSFSGKVADQIAAWIVSH